MIIRHSSPVKTQPVEIVTEIRPEISRVVIQDDPKTISEMNKLTSLNQFLSHQYNLINNELLILKNRTCHKEFVDDKAFMQKSLNRIDDIFMRETNQAIHRLDEISKCASSKGFTRQSYSKVKRDHSPPNFNRKVQHSTGNSELFTPMKGLEAMQNSSYFECHHYDPT